MIHAKKKQTEINDLHSMHYAVKNKNREIILFQKSKSSYMNVLQPENKIPLDDQQNASHSLSSNTLYQEPNELNDLNNEHENQRNIERNSWLNFF